MPSSAGIPPSLVTTVLTARIRTAEKQYRDAFEDELSSLKARVRQRAIDRKREAEDRAAAAAAAADAEAEEERKVPPRVPRVLTLHLISPSLVVACLPRLSVCWQARLGPGGLDPLEVLESLPKDIRDAFENQDTPKLQAAFAALPPEVPCILLAMQASVSNRIPALSP